MLDHGTAYEGIRHRIDELTRGSDGSTPVEMCPGWTVRDVVAHLTGLCEDWVAGNLTGYASDAWTAAQVARFDGVPLDAILDRWHEVAPAFASLPDDEVMGRPARYAFGDAVSHEADVRGALGAGRVPDDVVETALKIAVGRWRAALAEAGAPTLHLTCPELRDWWLGTPDDPGAVELTAPAYEVFRALAGRRSAAQVASWTWSADPTPFIDAGIGYPFTWARTDVRD